MAAGNCRRESATLGSKVASLPTVFRPQQLMSGWCHWHELHHGYQPDTDQFNQRMVGMIRHPACESGAGPSITVRASADAYETQPATGRWSYFQCSFSLTPLSGIFTQCRKVEEKRAAGAVGGFPTERKMYMVMKSGHTGTGATRVR